MSKSRTSRSKGEDTNPDYALPGIGNYIFQKTVGEGNFAKVKLAKHKMTGQEVAVKVIDKTQLDEKKLGKLYREVRIMKLLRHPNIVRLYEVIETKSTVFLVMEYSSGGELYDYLVVHGRMKEKEARAKFRQILSAVSYCHKKKVIHRDLKAENLLLDANLDIKIADFGFSNLYDPDGKLDTFCGSPPYAAPELFQGRRYVGPEVDIWSLGVILYVLTTGCLPFDGKNLQEMRESVCRGKYRIPFYLSDSCEKLLRKFLVRDPSKRATLDIIKDDPWVNEGYSSSPILPDLSQHIGEDDAVIQIMETKFHIDRETTLKSLRGNHYDDTAAIYYLLYHERFNKGEYGEIRRLDAGPTLREGGGGAPRPNSMIQQTATAAAAMGAIDENTESHGKTDPRIVKLRNNGGGAHKSAGSRQRRYTVTGGDRDKKFDAEQQQSEDAHANFKQPAKENETFSGVGAKPATMDPPAHQRAHLNANQTPREIEEGETGVHDDQAVDDGGSSGDKPREGGRKRHNTIVGIFRNHIRRQSEAGTGAMPGATPLAGAVGGGVDSDGKPRSLRFTFNSNTTSSKPPDDVITEVLHGCTKLGVRTKLTGRFLVEASYAQDTVKFEIEVCKLPRLKNLHGLRFKRVSGPSSEYKDICERLLNTISL